jgi:hypothetical protein
MNEKIIEMFDSGKPITEIMKATFRSYSNIHKVLSDHFKKTRTKIQAKHAMAKLEIDEMIQVCKAVPEHQVLTVGDVYFCDGNLFKWNNKKIVEI